MCQNMRIDKKAILSLENYKQFLQKLKTITYNDIVVYMYQPTDPAGLGIIRFFFGLLMVIDIPEERGGADLDLRWGNEKQCHFPLFSFMKAPSYHYIALLYAVMWLGALGIMLGYKFHLSTLFFGIPYWYIFLLDKSFWNNHSYLFGLVSILLMGSSANHYFSLDALLDSSKRNKSIPYWNYFILKFQFIILYFFAGLKKTDWEWLEGYSMMDLGRHWVFSPFQYFLAPERIDYLVVHWFGFLLDLTIAFWMMLESTRLIAMILCTMFHLMNSRLFSIGMFPYVCIATMPLFCEPDWPRKLEKVFKVTMIDHVSTAEVQVIYNILDSKPKVYEKTKWKHKIIVAILMGYCGLQIFLPYSHSITKGFNNWTNGLYGYSWDMMVHSWDTVIVVVKATDNISGKEYFVDPSAYTQNDRWNKHADMCVQYANCLKDNIAGHARELPEIPGDSMRNFPLSDNISIYVDIWCSLNKRFQQRMFDPNYDLLQANWSLFEPVEWLLPLLSEYNNFRRTMSDIMEDVYSWSNESDVLFIADFPGLTLENYIQDDLSNITLTVLEGEIAYEIEDDHLMQSLGLRLKKGDSIPVDIGVFHKVHTISSTPSCYMYTYMKSKSANYVDIQISNRYSHSPFPIFEDFEVRVNAFLAMWKHITNSVLYLLFNIPYTIRTTK